MDNKISIEELYPHLFMNDARSMVTAMLKVDDEASKIKAKATGKLPEPELTFEEKRKIAFQCLENNKKNERERYKLEQARSMQKKNLREYDPRVGIEERHLKVTEKRQNRIAKANPEEKLDQLRAERQKLIEEISPEAIEKIKQEVKREAQQAKKQDMDRRKEIKEAREIEKIARQKEELAAEIARQKRILLENRLFNFSKTLNTIWRTYYKNSLFYCFERLNFYAIALKTKSIKISRKYRFKRILKGFNVWKTVSVKIKIAEEAAIFEAEQEKILYLNQLAQQNYQFWLKRRAFEGLEKFVTLARIEKEQQIEAVRRRQQFNSFMNFIKLRTEEEANKKKDEEALKQMKIFKEKQEIEQILYQKNKQAENKNFFIRNQLEVHKNQEIQTYQTIPKQDAYTEIDEESKFHKSIEEESKPSKSNESKPISNDPIPMPESNNLPKASPDNKKPTKISKMQARQEERKAKREALEAKYKEKRDKEDQEKREAELKAKEEEKKRKKEIIDKKKQEEKNKKEIEEKKKKGF
jgi:hypothetical protein